MTATRLILMPAMASEPAPYLIISPNSVVLERGVLAIGALQAPERMPTVAVAPGTDVAVAWLDLSRGSAAQVRAAALWALRDALATPPERVAVALGPVPTPGEARLVAVVSQPLLQAWIDYLDALGVRADTIVPDMLTVGEPDDDGSLNLVAFGPNVALRGHRFAASVQPDLVPVIAGGRALIPVEDAAAVERMLITAGVAPVLNLLDGAEREPGRGRAGWRRAVALAVTGAVAPLLLVAAAAGRDAMEAARMREAARAAVVAALPDAANASDPVGEARRRAAAAPPPGGVTAAIAALYVAVESVEGAELDMLTASPEGGVRATISYAGYQDLTALKRAMARAGLSLRDSSTLDDGGRVVSDVVIGAAA